jgi:hypothetical protein
MKYECKECGMAVIVTEEGAVRFCKHNDAPIVANMSAEAHVSAEITSK